MLKKRMKDGGKVVPEPRLSMSGGRNAGRNVAGGRLGVSIPVGKDAEIEPYYEGPLGSTDAARNGGKVGITFTKRFARGGRVRDYSKK